MHLYEEFIAENFRKSNFYKMNWTWRFLLYTYYKERFLCMNDRNDYDVNRNVII